MADFELRQGDSGRVLQVHVLNADGSDPTLPPGTTAVFRMVSKTGHVVTGAAVLSNPAGLTTNNLLAFTFVAGSTDVVGCYDAEFIATYPSSGGTETFPTSSAGGRGLTVEVVPKV